MQDKSKEGTAQPEPLQIAENLFAAEVYADSAAYFSLKGGNVCITFTSVRFDNSVSPGQPRNVVIGRLVMPALGAHQLAVGLFDYLKRNGLKFDPPASSGN
jgi:hypothetical protein